MEGLGEELVAAAKANNKSKMKQILARSSFRSPALEYRDRKKGGTPAHFAAAHDAAACLEMLLVKGADIEAKSNHGWTPAHDAASKNAAACLEML